MNIFHEDSPLNKAAMTIDQMNVVAKHVFENHSVNAGSYGRADRSKCKMVKYMRPQIDMRTGNVFAIMFETWTCGDQFFTVSNNGSKNLFQDIMDWLESEIKR